MHCKNCGKEIDDKDYFCVKCGIRLNFVPDKLGKPSNWWCVLPILSWIIGGIIGWQYTLLMLLWIIGGIIVYFYIRNKNKYTVKNVLAITGIELGIISLMLPFLYANHYILSEGKRYIADSIQFFFWGKSYTVVGADTIQSQTIMYDFGDFPIYAMGTIVIGLIVASISLLFDTRNFNTRLIPVVSVILLLIAYLYMNDAIEILITALEKENYVTESAYSLLFLMGSIVVISMSTLVSYIDRT